MTNSIKNVHDLGLLFEKVQTESIFADNKTFPDCIAKSCLNEINAKFLAKKDENNFDLKSFVLENFTVPVDKTETYESDKNHTIDEHLSALWSILTREPDHENSSLIPLPYPYIVPGGRFREVYYWDSYFSMLGLQISRKIDLIQSMLDNFSYLLDKVGHIPNGNRTYYVGRSQPPFYALMVRLLSEEKGLQILVDYLPFLEKEYEFWMLGSEELSQEQQAIHRVVRMPDGSILNRFWDENDTPRPESYKEDVELAHLSNQKPEELFRHLRAAAESGWDFSSRWFRETNSFESIHTTDIIPVDLNSLLVHLEETIAGAYSLKADKNNTKRFKTLAENRKKAIQNYCWNEAKGFYFDYDFVENTQKQHFTLAAAFPLFSRIAPDAQAKSVARILEQDFLKSGGLLTTLSTTGQQWDAPNGWAPLQWIAYKGLLNYKFNDLANQVKNNWVNLNKKVYEQTGKMTEKYNVNDQNQAAGGGEYPNQDGFGWTNGVFLAMSK